LWLFFSISMRPKPPSGDASRASASHRRDDSRDSERNHVVGRRRARPRVVRARGGRPTGVTSRSSTGSRPTPSSRPRAAAAAGSRSGGETARWKPPRASSAPDQDTKRSTPTTRRDCERDRAARPPACAKKKRARKVKRGKGGSTRRDVRRGVQSFLWWWVHCLWALGPRFGGRSFAAPWLGGWCLGGLKHFPKDPLRAPHLAALQRSVRRRAPEGGGACYTGVVRLLC
jgi:hypothetical protein